MKIYTRKKQIR